MRGGVRLNGGRRAIGYNWYNGLMYSEGIDERTLSSDFLTDIEYQKVKNINIYETKEYPTCHCGRRYVPIHKGDTECFFCQFTRK